VTQLDFIAPEYGADGTFTSVSYRFSGDRDTGWKIYRDGEETLQLGPGYVPVQSLYCGICSTDLARKFLPYPLPQIIGHEVVGLHDDKPVTVEINASHRARGLQTACPFCAGGMETQCPDRVTLGIDRLPGGFAPWFLAPIDAIHKLPDGIDPVTATLTEPFAAALHAVHASGPKNGRVAVLGPRRLGMLLLAALNGYRSDRNLSFEIDALIRHPELERTSLAMGADRVVQLQNGSTERLESKYDIVFDTTGKPEGLHLALKLAKRIVHLKSTNGAEVLGMDHLTDMVVDEIAIVPFDESRLRFSWSDESDRPNRNIFVAPGVSEERIAPLEKRHPELRFHRLTIEEALRRIDEGATNGRHFPEGSPFPRFDLAIAATPETVDAILRPAAGREISLVRPRGAILFDGTASAPSELADAVCGHDIEIHTSRCGDFSKALAVLHKRPDIAEAMKTMITQIYPLDQITEAFRIAADSSQSIKVIVQTSSREEAK